MRLRTSLPAIIVGVFLAAGVTASGEDEKVMTLALCDLVTHMETRDLEDARLAVSLAESELSAMERIFELADSLREKEAIQEMVFLESRHARDVARLMLNLRQRDVDRQQAVLDQIRANCEPVSESARREEEAMNVYRRVDCDIQAIALEIAKTDRDFFREVLVSVRRLRDQDVATEEDVIRARLDLERSETRIREMTRRSERCRSGEDSASTP